MTGYLLKHIVEYILVLAVIATAVSAAYLLPDTQLRRTAVIAAAALYPLWAIVHHWKKRNLTATTVLEYLAFTLLLAWTLLVIV